MQLEMSTPWSLLAVGAGIGSAFGAIIGLLHPYLPLLNVLGMAQFSTAAEMVSIVADVKLPYTLGFGLLIGAIAGGWTAIIGLMLSRSDVNILLLSPVALLCGLVAVGIFSTPLLREATGTGEAQWVLGSLFSPAAAFTVAVGASLHAGLWTCFSLTRRRTRAADRTGS